MNNLNIPQFHSAILPTVHLDNSEAVEQWMLADTLRPDMKAWVDLERRGLCCEILRDEDLVRVVSSKNNLSGMWERARVGDMLVQTTGSLGFVKGLRKISVTNENKWIKLAPKKRDPKHEVTLGRVMANHTAKIVLGGLTRIAPKVCIIVEGESDFFTWSTLSPESMVIGIVNGCWNLEIAAFIPKGICVLLLTDADIPKPGLTGAGDRYAAEIGRTLKHHKLFRYTGVMSSSGKNHDQNSLLVNCVVTSLQGIKPFIKSYTPPEEEVVVVKPVDREAGRKVFGGDQEKRIQWWRDYLSNLAGQLRGNAYDGNRFGALKAIRPLGLAIKDGLLSHSEVQNTLEAAYVNGQKRERAIDRRKMISDAIGS